MSKANILYARLQTSAGRKAVQRLLKPKTPPVLKIEAVPTGTRAENDAIRQVGLNPEDGVHIIQPLLTKS